MPASTKPLAELTQEMRLHAHPGQAKAMAAYMKDHFPFLGIKQPLRKEISKPFIKASREWAGMQVIELARSLWGMPEREFHYVAMDVLEANRKKWDAHFLDCFLYLAGKNQWWDSIDTIASRLIGKYLYSHPDKKLVHQWTASEDIWMNRIALLYQLNYKEKTDTKTLFTTILKVKHKKDFFIQKAIGWSLRQLYRTDQGSVKTFLESVELTPLARREALKHDMAFGQ